MFKPVKFGLGIAVTVISLVLALWVVSKLPGSLNPFHTTTVDRSQPVVVKSIEDLGQYRASSANMQIVVDLTKDTRFVPDFIKGERTLFVAAGTVDAGVDFGTLPEGAVVVNQDRTQVTITLPAPRLYDPEVDLERSSVIDRRRGVLDRIGDLVGDGPTEQEVLVLAERKLREAAAADPRVLQQAQTNTRAMLESLLGSLGFTTVTIRFAPPDPT